MSVSDQLLYLRVWTFLLLALGVVAFAAAYAAVGWWKGRK